MELTEVIDMISKMYRAELSAKRNATAAVDEINKEFQAAQEKDWETMTYARWSELNRERATIEQDQRYYAIRAEAMSDVREMFLELLDQEMMEE